MKTKFFVAPIIAATLGAAQAQTSFTSTSANTAWNANRWNNSSDGPTYTSVFTANNAASFTSGNYTFAGMGTTVSVGNVTLANNVNVTFSGATGAYGTGTTVRTFNIGTGSTFNFGDQKISTGVGFIKTGAGTLVLPTSNDYSGKTTLSGGTVSIDDESALGMSPGSFVADRITFDGGTILARKSFNFSSNRGITLGGGGGTFNTDVNNISLISVITGSGALSKTGSGNLVASGVHTYTGATNIQQGTLQLTNGNNRLPTATTLSLGQAATANLGAFDLNAQSQQIAGLNSTSGTNATAGNNTVFSSSVATLTLGGAGTYSYGDGSNANSGVISGAISIVKSGSGTQTLGDANTYTGTTQVTGGRLVVNGTHSGAGAVTVSNAGSTLSGIGTIAGATTIQTGAIHAPGTGPGVQKFTTTMTYNDGAIFSWDINRAATQTRGTGYDAVNVTGTLAGLDGGDAGSTFDAIFRVVITDNDFSNSFWDTSRTWTDIFTAANGTTVKTNWASIFGGGFQYYNSTGIIASPGSQGSFSLTGTTLSWTANPIPEPTNALAGLLIAAGLLRRRRAA